MTSEIKQLYSLTVSVPEGRAIDHLVFLQATRDGEGFSLHEARDLLKAFSSSGYQVHPMETGRKHGEGCDEVVFSGHDIFGYVGRNRVEREYQSNGQRIEFFPAGTDHLTETQIQACQEVVAKLGDFYPDQELHFVRRRR